MERKILLLTQKNDSELNCSLFSNLLELYQINFVQSASLDIDMTQFDTIVVDQYIDEKLNTALIEEKRLPIGKSHIYLLISRALSEKEEQIINSNKISILSMPINQAEIFNRIINVN